MEKITVNKHDVAGFKAFLDGKLREGYVLSSIKGKEAEFVPASGEVHYFLMFGRPDGNEINQHGLSYVGTYGSILVFTSKEYIEQDIVLAHKIVLLKREVFWLSGILALAVLLALSIARHVSFLVQGSPLATGTLAFSAICAPLCIVGILAMYLEGRKDRQAPEGLFRIRPVALSMMAVSLACLFLGLASGASRGDWSREEGKEDIVAGMDVPFATLADMSEDYEPYDASKMNADLDEKYRVYGNKYVKWPCFLLDGDAYAWHEEGMLDGKHVGIMLEYYPLKTKSLAKTFFRQSVKKEIVMEGADEAGRLGERLVFRVGKCVYYLNVLSEEAEAYEEQYVSLVLQDVSEKE